jgi:hypothetical protein
MHSLLVGAVAALSGGPSFLAIMLSARTSASDSEDAVSLADQCARCRRRFGSRSLPDHVQAAKHLMNIPPTRSPERSPPSRSTVTSPLSHLTDGLGFIGGRGQVLSLSSSLREISWVSFRAGGNAWGFAEAALPSDVGAVLAR